MWLGDLYELAIALRKWVLNIKQDVRNIYLSNSPWIGLFL